MPFLCFLTSIIVHFKSTNVYHCFHGLHTSLHTFQSMWKWGMISLIVVHVWNNSSYIWELQEFKHFLHLIKTITFGLFHCPGFLLWFLLNWKLFVPVLIIFHFKIIISFHIHIQLSIVSHLFILSFSHWKLQLQLHNCIISYTENSAFSQGYGTVR